MQPDTRKMFDRLYRIMLRMVPLVPGPEILDLVIDLRKSRTDLDTKIARAQQSLQETSALIDELESGLSQRVDKLNKLKAEYDKYSRLAELEEEKASAVVQQIEFAIGRNRGKERLIALALNLFAGLIVFALGVLLGPHLMRILGA